MAKTSYLCRRGARYHYRRRVYLREIVNKPITISLRTADPVEARRLSARLSVRWELTSMIIEGMGRGYLKGPEAVALFRQGLEDEIGVASAGMYDHDGPPDVRTSRVFAAMYRIAARLKTTNDSVSLDLIEAQTPDFSVEERNLVGMMLRAYAPHRSIETAARKALSEIDGPLSDRVIADAGVQLLMGRAEAQARMGFFNHPDVVASGNAIAQLLDDGAMARIRTTPTAPPAPVDLSGSSPFLTIDTRRLSDVIDSVVADIQATRDWNEDIAQRLRVIRGFAWITGDKRLCDYGPSDAQLFAATMRALPTEFRWGTSAEGNMSRPFADVMAEIKTLGGSQRSDRTVNRDLTTLSRFARELAKTAWKPRYGKDPVLDFAAFASAGPVDDPDDPDRMPWTDDHLRVLFSSPIYTGGGACARRLKHVNDGAVWQDGAYWVPLLLTYGILTREEACGIECEDFVFDVATPFVAIKANMTKSKDGKTKAGLKRPSRRRMVPLHPELLRLGLREYVEAVETAGHVAVFPELYQAGMTNVGGKRFYASAGRYLLAYVDGTLPLPRTAAGKRADLHSLRTTGGSALELSETKQLVVDDIMGHARDGTGPRKYSKAWFAKGGETVLAKRLEAMIAALPSVTRHVQKTALRLLPLHERSRTGSAKGCASR